MSNFNELNKVLFDTLNEAKAGKIKRDQLADICTVSSVIIENAKVQVNAAKLMKGSSLKSEFFGVLQAPKRDNILSASLYDQKLEHALSLGHDSLASAIGEMGKNPFEQSFKDSLKL